MKTNHLVYHYTTRDAAIEHILAEGQLRLGQMHDSNDPAEGLARFSLTGSGDEIVKTAQQRLMEATNQARDQIFRNVLILCLSRDDAGVGDAEVVLDQILGGSTAGRGFARDRMWAQYAQNHAGLCLFLDRAKLQDAANTALGGSGRVTVADVQYTDGGNAAAWSLDAASVLAKPEEYLPKQQEQYAVDYYFTKRTDWAGESEVRVVMLPHSQTQFACVPIRGALAALCVGARFPRAYRPCIERACVELGVPAYQFNYSYSPFLTRYVDISGKPYATIGGFAGAK